MADAILRAILARPILPVMSDARIPTELWESAYAYDRARARLENDALAEQGWGTLWIEKYTRKKEYRAALAKFSDVLPEILKNLESENE